MAGALLVDDGVVGRALGDGGGVMGAGLGDVAVGVDVVVQRIERQAESQGLGLLRRGGGQADRDGVRGVL